MRVSLHLHLSAVFFGRCLALGVAYVLAWHGMKEYWAVECRLCYSGKGGMREMPLLSIQLQVHTISYIVQIYEGSSAGSASALLSHWIESTST